MKNTLLAFLGSAMLSMGAAHAGGFQANLQGQKQIGMGHAGTGLALDQSSIFFNPGALAKLRQNGIQIGVSALNAKIAYREPAPGNSETLSNNPLSTPFQAYASYGAEGSAFRFGIGVYTPYGSSVNWGRSWQGRYNLNELTLQAIFIQPTVSYSITDKLSVGAGFIYSIGKVNLQRSLPLQTFGGYEGSVELDGNARGFGYNLGVYFQPSEKLSFGLTYRSQVEMEVKEGNVSFLLPSSPVVTSQFQATQFDAEVPLPANITLGIGFQPTENLTIAADVQRVQWSAYKSLRFDYDAPIRGETFTQSERNYEDVFIYRLGAQYKVSEAFTIRGGAYYDNSPVQEGYLTPETPDSDSRGISGGVTISMSEKVDLDLSFLYINKKERTDDASKSGGVPGTFKSVAYIPGVGITYKL